MAARADAEAPQLLRRLLVMVDEIVELERVDLTGVVPSQPVAHALDQPLKLGFVVPADGRAGSAPARLRRLRGDAGSDRTQAAARSGDPPVRSMTELGTDVDRGDVLGMAVGDGAVSWVVRPSQEARQDAENQLCERVCRTKPTGGFEPPTPALRERSWGTRKGQEIGQKVANYQGKRPSESVRERPLGTASFPALGESLGESQRQQGTGRVERRAGDPEM